MKILIIANGFTGTTLPLANKLASLGNKVKCFYIVERGSKSIESLDFDAPISIGCGKIVYLSKKNKLYNYLNLNVDIALMPTWKTRRRLEKIGIGKVFPMMNYFLMLRYVGQILKEQPDVVNLIVHNTKEVFIANMLKRNGIPFTITYHEVLNRLVGKEELRRVVSQTINLNTPIICHSKKTAKDLVSNVEGYDVKPYIKVINFGPFESYLSYGNGYLPQGVPQRYLLYLGHIHPYKGLKYLYDAVVMLGKELGPVKIVVAGNGNDPILEQMKQCKSFLLINRFIENAELVGLIKNCMAIICPYIAASQSGLVQTGMVFKKPIIATRVGSFAEFIRNGENGFLCESEDAQSLALSIKSFLNNEKQLEFSDMPSNLNWDHIANEYMTLYNNMANI